MKNTIDTLLENMWLDYIELNPEAHKIYKLFAKCNNGKITNDHIALRTFDLDAVNIDVIAKPFEELGYKKSGSYQFQEKNLRAFHYQHDDGKLPKIFISELITQSLTKASQDIICNFINQLNPEKIHSDSFCYSGRSWDISHEDYLKLREESEYAAWLGAIGFRPNHFTILVNDLTSHNTIEEVSRFLEENGFKLNTHGGIVKGDEKACLKQISTMANLIEVTFSEGSFKVPGCYYEFAERFELESGIIYQGFIANSADKIFESTNSEK